MKKMPWVALTRPGFAGSEGAAWPVLDPMEMRCVLY
jgi:hypothetical protein